MKKSTGAKRKVYTFSVDPSDPRHAALVNFLEGTEARSRSFLIRQMLNYCLNEENANVLKASLQVNPLPASESQGNLTVSEMIEADVRPPETPVVVEPTVETQVEDTKDETEVPPAMETAEEKTVEKKKMVVPKQMMGLKNMFN